MENMHKGRLGFTLIELLVVVLIIGILAAIAVPQYQKAVEKARFTEYIGWVRRLYHSQKEYYLAVGTWGSDFKAFSMDFPSGTRFTGNGVTLPNGQSFSYNKNNSSLQFSYKTCTFNLALTTGNLDCYHYGDATKKEICRKVATSCGQNTCSIAKFGK